MTVALLTAAGAHAASSYDARTYSDRLLALVNAARGQQGLRPLVQTAGTTEVASAWTRHLAGAHTLSHNPKLGRQLSANGSRAWRTYGENVGVGSVSDPDGLFAAYMHSPEHRANILNRNYRYVGVSVLLVGSRSWNTFDFVDVYGSAPARHTMHHRTRPAVVTAATRPVAADAATTTSVAAPAATVQTPPVRPTHQRAARPAGPVVVHVKGLRHSARHPRMTTVAAPVAVPAPAAASPPALSAAANTTPVSHRRNPAPVALAVAIFALCFSARRWLLVTSPATT